MENPISVLSINASDSMAQVGIQADIRTITALGGNALTAITSVAIQDNQNARRVYNLSPEAVAGQIRAVKHKCHPLAVKVGLLGHSDTLMAVEKELEGSQNIVMAPGMISSSGLQMVEADVVRLWERNMFPKATLLLLRVAEAELILGMRIRTDGDMERAARLLLSTGAQAVLLRGGRLSEDRLTAYLLDSQKGQFFSSTNTEGWQRHGVSSALSSAIATRMALGDSIAQSVSNAHAYMHSQVVYAVDNRAMHAFRPADIYNNFMSLIAAHYATEHNIASYASRLSVSQRYLNMVTLRMVGRTPKQILDSCLVGKASSLLLNSRLTIQEVSQRLGFSSQASFCIFFGRQTGQTPSEHRKKPNLGLFCEKKGE